MHKAHLFVANDDKRLLEVIQHHLQDEGYQATIVRAGDQAFREIREALPALVIVDIKIQHSQPSWKMIDELKHDPATSSIPIIICVGDLQSMREREGYVREHEYHVLKKPYTMEELLALVQTVLAGGRANHPGE